MTSGEVEYDAVVVGSGFGGSINACRLAESGKSVLVIERGRRYHPGDFPRDVTDIDQLFWQYPRRKQARGLYDVRFFSGIAAVMASGLGGGSLIYANIHIRPDAVVFDDPRWPQHFTRAALDRYFDRVAKMMGVAPLPPEVMLAKRDVFRDAADRIGRAVFDPDQAVNWNGASKPGRETCRMCTECEFGCQYGAKNTLDFTYLAQAEKLGAQIRTGVFITHVEPVQQGYRVHGVDLDTGDAFQATGKRVVISAGTVGTNTIMFRSRDHEGTLPDISQRLGYGYSGNGDFLGSIHDSGTDLKPWEGPDVTSVMRFFDEDPRFTLAAPSFSRPVMAVLASLGDGPGNWSRVLSPLWHQFEKTLPWAFQRGLLSHPGHHPGDPSRMTNLFAIGRDNANGRIHMRGKKLDIEWDYEGENGLLIERMTAAMQQVAQAYGGIFEPLATWKIFRKIITVHSLGGCHLSDSPAQGVISPHGEVHGYPGLFIADGSVIPTAIGFHPVMTISAVSERIADAVVASY